MTALPPLPDDSPGDPGPWLEALDLAEHAPAFRAQAVTLDLVPTLSDADLQALGVATLGHRKRILAAAVGLKPVAAPSTAGVLAALTLRGHGTSPPRPTPATPDRTAFLPAVAQAALTPAVSAAAAVFAGYVPLAYLPAPLQDPTGLVEPLQWGADALLVTGGTLAVFAVALRTGLQGARRLAALGAGTATVVALAAAICLEPRIIAFNLLEYGPLLFLLAALAAHGRPVRAWQAAILALLPFALWLFGEFGLHRIPWEAEKTVRIHDHIAASILGSLVETQAVLVAVAVGLRRVRRAVG